eukprot:8188014-Pyramimonas_sp.AAC.1
MERKHRVLKRFATPRQNLTGYSRGLMEEVTLQHLRDLHTPIGGVGLCNPRPAPQEPTGGSVGHSW